MNAFIIFQYANGLGHLTRCSALAAALRSIASVTMFSGGRPVEGYRPPPGVDFVQLPAIWWSRGADARPLPVDPQHDASRIEALRSDMLLQAWRRLQPRVVIIEYYPFAPRRFGAALDGLFAAIAAAEVKPLVVCSIRAFPRLHFLDADTPPAWINQQLHDHFALVLHHVDPQVIPLESMGPYFGAALRGMPVVQTGYVRRPVAGAPAAQTTGEGLLLTVGGGGVRGAALLQHWIAAARLAPAQLFPLRVVCGPMMSAADRATMALEQRDDVQVFEQVSDMDRLMREARAVVCLGGYNTAVEALSLGKPVLAFPADRESDQYLQIQAMADRGLLLAGDPEMAIDAISALMRQLLQFRAARAIDVDGAARSAAVIRQWLDDGRTR